MFSARIHAVSWSPILMKCSSYLNRCVHLDGQKVWSSAIDQLGHLSLEALTISYPSDNAKSRPSPRLGWEKALWCQKQGVWLPACTPVELFNWPQYSGVFRWWRVCPFCQLTLPLRTDMGSVIFSSLPIYSSKGQYFSDPRSFVGGKTVLVGYQGDGRMKGGKDGWLDGWWWWVNE